MSAVCWQYKSKVREQQHEREKEQNSHGLMLRELQTLLTSEKNARETLESQLEELRFEHDELQQSRLPSNDDASEQEVRELQGALQKAQAQRTRLEGSVKEAKEETEAVKRELQQAKVRRPLHSSCSHIYMISLRFRCSSKKAQRTRATD